MPGVLIILNIRTIYIQFRKALQAADHILIKLRYPDNPKALTVKGEALYKMGDFEHALVSFHRAMKTASTKVPTKTSITQYYNRCLFVIYLVVCFSMQCL